MFFVGILLVSFTPGLFWLWFYLRKDSHQPAPRRLIALTFGLGCLATIPAAIIEYVVLGESFLEERAGVAAVAPGMLLVVGPVEEISKFLAVRLKAYRSLYFDEPIDGLVYAAAASLGFASLENLFYVMEFGPEVMLVRAPISTLAHLVFGCIWGYALGLHHASGGRRTLLVIGALALGAFTHAVFNILVSAPLLIPFALVLVTGGALMGVWPVQLGTANVPIQISAKLPQHRVQLLWPADQGDKSVLPLLWLTCRPIRGTALLRPVRCR